MVVTEKLDNGIRIVQEHIPGARSVSIGIWILAGSRNEERHHGISHLIEHMMFKGTEKFTAKEIAEAFDSIGGDVNAFTSKEYTSIYATVVDRHAGFAWNVLSDMFLNSTFDEKELEREKKVIEEEIDMVEDTPDDIIHDYLHDQSFQGHPLSHSVLGTKESLANIYRKDILRYRNQYYVPNRIVISVAGNINQSLIDQMAESMSDFPNNELNDDSLYSAFTPVNYIEEKEANQAHLCLGFPGVPITDDRIFAMAILDNIIGGSMSSRLFQEIREERGLAYSVFSYHSTFKDNGLVVLYGGTNPSQAEEMEQVILQVTKDLSTKGMTDKELEQSKEQMKGQLILGLEHSTSRMQKNGKTALLNLLHHTADDLISKVESVTLQDVNELADLIFENDPSRAFIHPADV